MSRRKITPPARPQEGGSFVRQKDGSLKRAAAPAEPAPETETAPAEPGSDKQEA